MDIPGYESNVMDNKVVTPSNSGKKVSDNTAEQCKLLLFTLIFSSWFNLTLKYLLTIAKKKFKFELLPRMDIPSKAMNNEAPKIEMTKSLDSKAKDLIVKKPLRRNFVPPTGIPEPSKSFNDLKSISWFSSHRYNYITVFDVNTREISQIIADKSKISFTFHYTIALAQSTFQSYS